MSQEGPMNIEKTQQPIFNEKFNAIRAIKSSFIENSETTPKAKETAAITFWNEVIEEMVGENTPKIDELCESKNISKESIFENLSAIWSTTKQYILNLADQIEVPRELLLTINKSEIDLVKKESLIEVLQNSLDKALIENQQQKNLQQEVLKNEISKAMVDLYSMIVTDEDESNSTSDISFINRVILLPDINESQLAYKSQEIQLVYGSIKEDLNKIHITKAEIGSILKESLQTYTQTHTMDIHLRSEFKALISEIDTLISVVG
jgi:hypothetical protein